MVDITTLAVQKIKEVMTTDGKEGWGLKVFSSGGGCCGPSFGMDIVEKPEDGDTTIEKDGLKIFADEKAVEGMKGLIVDFVDDGEQQGFVMKQDGPMDEAGGCSCDSGTCN